MRISTYSRMQAFLWRSSHGKLFANKHFHAMGIKEEAKCTYCNEDSQSLKHLYIDCHHTKSLFANFERQYKVAEPLTDLEKLIGVDPSRKRTKLFTKRINILRRLIYQFNHRDEKPRWGNYLDLVERVYVYEYAIADEKGKVLQHLKIWGK